MGSASTQVDRVNLRDGRTTSITPMLNRRYGASAVGCDGFILVFGGYDSEVLSSCEKYDPVANR